MSDKRAGCPRTRSGLRRAQPDRWVTHSCWGATNRVPQVRKDLGHPAEVNRLSGEQPSHESGRSEHSG